MEREEIVSWLLEGDVSVQYQTHRDLLNSEPVIRKDLKERIATEGWGRSLLEKYHPEGYWGMGFYQPKWTSTHYTLLDLRNLCIPSTHEITQAIDHILDENIAMDGGINPSKTKRKSDVCINGMFLNYACYFGVKEERIQTVVDCLIENQMGDGGFNCMIGIPGTIHSSVHSTISVLEGIREYVDRGYGYRLEEMKRMELEAREFLLVHRLFRSHRTGEVINPMMLRYYYPSRWRYNILRSLDYFRKANATYDDRMGEALDKVKGKRLKTGLWKLPAHLTGAVHFHMEEAGKASRWNTLIAMRVLEYYSWI